MTKAMLAAVAVGYKISQGDKTWQMQFFKRACALDIKLAAQTIQQSSGGHNSENVTKCFQTTASFLR